MVGHSRRDREGLIKRNNYQGFGIELIVRGNAVFIQDGKEFLVNAPGAFCKLPGSNHEYRTGPAGFLLKRVMAMQIPSFSRLAALMDFPADTPITVRDINRISGYFKEAVCLMTRKDRDVSIEPAGIGFQVLPALSRVSMAWRKRM
jgi:hypothetical protein